ncbi:hypothetical protein B0T21DRAFT_411474 [Apiosordaria backusii]|uniref:FAD-binding domain-containing protein n=1 Tax=Apiosordaria backusii TaxID=314023 RepID=A0AA40BL74_9PEZI|nr:hypothetical protein B0T21DRAFT_411474 [Apiosordaria backusii]
MPGATTKDIHVAIVGAGIAGITLGLGLRDRNVPFTIYERAPGFRDIGAGIGFSPNAEKAMEYLSKGVLKAFKRVANPNGEDYFQWVDGHSPQGELMYKKFVGKDGFQGCKRSDILEAWASLLPPGSVEFEKELDGIEEKQDGALVRFKDGSEVNATVVVGCDGIRSQVRHYVLGSTAKNPVKAAYPGYTQKFCYRSLVPMDQAIKAIGEYKASTRFMYNGPDAHIITYPVGNNSVLNVLVVISDSNKEWPKDLVAQGRHTCQGSKKEVIDAFKGWNETARNIANLFPEEMEKWAIFDMAENPASTFVRGRVCIAGDAAHATGPHLGAGGGLGIEDAYFLATLLSQLNDTLKARALPAKDEGEIVRAALHRYNDARFERTQWVVQATREAVDLFQWQDQRVGNDKAKFGEEISAKFEKIWTYDVVGENKKAAGGFLRDMGADSGSSDALERM